ncbi:tripartite tricarboxylate transporter TctB family protein [Paracoccus aestuariivivens]|uniref:Tripartite tricarboxylate transporter TctB family protein n=1 Tax=Paracoccus aestuariivivens TaxID=1820333 RepID=A0A6L6J3T2_9RHOB|nr:tripartite tricarboxylate transporter TctB family protein [Paracoccus aestuariivivens]MTH76550.1 tripartite tricarboxylate transporter TctB family protein [Paracoccus aestuariivivens]
MSAKPKDRTDIATGLLLMAAAVFFGWQTMGLEIGTSLRMGPGYFPMVLSGLLFLLGLLVFLKAFGREDEPFGKVAWRGMAFILPAPVFFGLTVRGLGFVPALFLAALIAAQASTRLKPLHGLVLAVIVTIASTLIFSYGLGLPFRRFGPWLQF